MDENEKTTTSLPVAAVIFAVDHISDVRRQLFVDKFINCLEETRSNKKCVQETNANLSVFFIRFNVQIF